MTTWLVLIALLLLAAAAGLFVVWLAPRRLAVRRRVMVNLVDGKAVSGVLWSQHGRLIVLKDATLHVPGAEPTPVDGEVLVERHRVDFVQVL